MSQTSRYLIAAVLAAGIAGCRDASESAARSDNAVDATSISTADSAGVQIVRISNVHGLALPRQEARLIYSTATDLLLGHVLGAVFLQDGSLVFADNASTEIIFLDPDGQLRGRMGRTSAWTPTAGSGLATTPSTRSRSGGGPCLVPMGCRSPPWLFPFSVPSGFS